MANRPQLSGCQVSPVCLFSSTVSPFFDSVPGMKSMRSLAIVMNIIGHWLVMTMKWSHTRTF